MASIQANIVTTDRLTESRRYARVRHAAPAAVLSPGNDEAILRTRIEELGMGGCRLHAPGALGVGRVVMLFLATEPEPVRAIAKVVYEGNAPDGGVWAGLEFVCLGPQEFFRLRDLLDTLTDAHVA